jgi:hypothetical protein
MRPPGLWPARDRAPPVASPGGGPAPPPTARCEPHARPRSTAVRPRRGRAHADGARAATVSALMLSEPGGAGLGTIGLPPSKPASPASRYMTSKTPTTPTTRSDHRAARHPHHRAKPTPGFVSRTPASRHKPPGIRRYPRVSRQTTLPEATGEHVANSQQTGAFCYAQPSESGMVAAPLKSWCPQFESGSGHLKN